MNINTYEVELSQSKIKELLECKYEASTLDFKLTFDTTNKYIEHREYLELVKDLVAFANTEGGYIIYGVEDATFKKCGVSPEVIINENKIKSYLDQYVDTVIKYIISDYYDEQDTHFIVIFVEPSKYSRPIVIQKEGQYQDTDTGKSKTVFSKNSVFVRNGTSSEPNLSYWYTIHASNGDQSKMKLVSVLHNLPKPNYGEHFVGRDNDIKKVIEGLLEEENTYRILVHGIGGLGKTALVQRVTSILMEKGIRREIPLDYIVWVSAKNEEYALSSIRRIRQDFRTLSDLVDAVIQVLNLEISFETALTEKAEMVKNSLRDKVGFIIVDNWETIEQDQSISSEILEYLLRIPGRNKIVITGRNRITDQNIKNVSPEPMKDEQGVKFLKRWRDNFNDPLLDGLSDHTLKRIANAAGGIPIAMIMSLGQISQGKIVSSVIDDLEQYEIDDPLLDFCFSETYKRITNNEKRILLALTYFTEPINRYLINAMTDFTPRDLVEALQKLKPYPFINIELQDNEHELIENYILNPLTRSFLKSELKTTPNHKEVLDENHKMIMVEKNQQVEITDMKDVIDRLHLTSDRLRLAASFAASATRVWKTTSNFTESKRKFDKARSLAPDLGYIYAQWAWVCEQAGEVKDARDYYSKAVKSEDGESSILKYRYQWGMFELIKGDHKEAEVQFNTILTSHPDDARSWHGLGRTLFLDFQKGVTVSLETIEKAFLRGFISRNRLRSETKHNAINAFYLALVYQEIGKNNKVDTYIQMGLRYDQTNAQLRDLLKSRKKPQEDGMQETAGKEIPSSSIYSGSVVKILPYGGFIENEGKTYFVHISQIVDEYVANINEYLIIDQRVNFRVINAEVGLNRYPQVTLRV